MENEKNDGITEEEIYKWIPGYEGHYKISNFGNVLSFKGKNNVNGKVKKLVTNPTGYEILGLMKNGKRKLTGVHIFVCTLFNGKQPTKEHQVNHIDGIKQNNYADNLEWCTRSENARHAHDNGLAKGGIGKKSVIQKTLNGDIINIYSSLHVGAKAVDGNANGISLACRKKLKTYKGFIWDYAQEIEVK